ncbi:MAG: hypothetical protein WD397_07290 [Wenzhouxiangellaceae bacterium]
MSDRRGEVWFHDRRVGLLTGNRQGTAAIDKRCRWVGQTVQRRR